LHNGQNKRDWEKGRKKSKPQAHGPTKVTLEKSYKGVERSGSLSTCDLVTGGGDQKNISGKAEFGTTVSKLMIPRRAKPLATTRRLSRWLAAVEKNYGGKMGGMRKQVRNSLDSRRKGGAKRPSNRTERAHLERDLEEEEMVPYPSVTPDENDDGRSTQTQQHTDGQETAKY